jgi:deferrochelatase/peroxidase EfeB
VHGRSTRRGFLAAAGVAGLSTTVGLGAETALADPGGDAVSFYGPHQAGIATSTQEHLQFVALDVVSDAVADVRGLLAQLTAASALMARGRPVGPLQTGGDPPVDTGETVGLAAAQLTVTFGLGPSLFARDRFGLESRRPAPLVDLPAFAGDALVPGLGGGDIGLQICANDPQVAFHAAHDLIRLATPTAVPRWAVAGFGRTANSTLQTTPRNLMGFKDGTNNIKLQDHAAFERYVWAGAPESPRWMRGGSYMVVRRIEMKLGIWDDTGLDQQEQTFGRHKISGAPIGGVHEHDPLRLKPRVNGVPVIPESAHIRQASPNYNYGQHILRRGYSYLDGIEHGRPSIAGGQFFICYQRDPRHQFIPIQRRLAANDALTQFITHIGSAVFACPPGVNGPGGYIGEGLLG